MEIKFTFFIISKSWVCRLKPENTNWRLGPITLLVMGAGAGRETVFLYCLISGLLSSLRFLSPLKGLMFPRLLKNASPLDTQKFETLPCWLSDSFSIHFVIRLLGPPDELNSLKNNNKTNQPANQPIISVLTILLELSSWVYAMVPFPLSDAGGWHCSKCLWPGKLMSRATQWQRPGGLGPDI